jgi:hypothetical protein|tara:strand:- start:3374 stop:3961 length:588 start_codon:yes stop_codon:yes gene_type:complete
MINIFGDNKAAKKSRKVRRKSKRLSATEVAKLGQEKLEQLNPMVIPLLAVKSQESPNNEFLKSSISVITERPHSLTSKWIGSLNKWVDSIVAGVLLDEPEIEEGARSDFGPLAVCNIVEAKMTSEYPMPAIICVDERGWKWYFKTSKAHGFVVGETITFTATVSGHKEGITFLRRPSKIKKVINIMAETKEGCDD